MRARLVGAAAVPLAALLALAGCSDSPSSSSSTSTSTSSSSTSAPTASTATGSAGSPSASPTTYPSLVATPAAAVGSVQGHLAGADPDRPVTVGVSAVRAGRTSTVLDYQLTAASGEVTINPNAFVLDSPTQGITLVAAAANLALYPEQFGATFQQRLGPYPPRTLGTQPAPMFLTFPPLPASVRQVEVRVPGMGSVSVPVTRG